MKWYEDTNKQEEILVSGRIRLERNISGRMFPGHLSEAEAEELVEEIHEKLSDLNGFQGKKYEFKRLDRMNQGMRGSYREKKILNQYLTRLNTPSGVFVSDDEENSIVINGEDHFRIQCFGSGYEMEKINEKIGFLDDLVNEKFAYAFDSKYGYLTSFPTNVGTGMKAGVLLHLPMLSATPRFRRLLGEMSRFGVTVRGFYSEENFGSLYEVSNHKTLGQSEEEIIALVNRVAMQLSIQEQKVRAQVLKTRRSEKTDEICKSYGILKYARRLTLKEAMMYLSSLRLGIGESMVETKDQVNIFGLMLAIQPMQIQQWAGVRAEKPDIPAARAEFLRAALPEMEF